MHTVDCLAALVNRCAFVIPLVFASCMWHGQALAQSNASKSANTDWRITRAEAVIQSRDATSANGLMVPHIVNFCVKGDSRGSSTVPLRAYFSSTKLSSRNFDSFGNQIQGRLDSMQEPLVGNVERCGTIRFDVHADLVTTLSPFSDAASPRLTVEGANNVATAAVKLVSVK